ncbi:unnamed protein product [Trichogramma brassicae]|uniref:Small-subunit processome Utp12 domain-containing protein n=1 Tax=Trichogramma brassicae TaxID=86971 RepID=A0A6H5IJR4_9HYME|nr:unnamed protein product [Trichogramma brassicae]
MKFAFKFSNLLGAVYHKGDLLFTPDGMSVISPVGNRISIFDLKNHKSMTLQIESRFNYSALGLSPNGLLLLAVNEGTSNYKNNYSSQYILKLLTYISITVGDAHLISMITKKSIHTHRFKGKVNCVKFSPNGTFFAVAKERTVFVYSSPGLESGVYNPFVMERVFHDATDDVTCLDWSFDSKLLIIGSKDTTTRLYSLDKYQNFKKYILGSHSHAISGCFFEKKSYDCTTISVNGQMCIWECSIDPDDLELFKPKKKKVKVDSDGEEDDVDLDKAIEKVKNTMKKASVSDTKSEEDNSEVNKLFYKRLAKHYLCDDPRKANKDVVLTAAAYHIESHILVVGFSNGSFYLYSMPEVDMVHSLSMSNQCISSIAVNPSGDWIALGSSELGQLLVWEWQSETYAMKQQGHSSNMTCMAYSPDGQYILTGGEDGKLKLWNTTTGFCTCYSANRKFIVSCSYDGTVRAYDLLRPVQFSCVALDSSDEFLAASGQDFFEIYLWRPVTSLAFNPNIASTELVSVSWDKTLKIWNAIENNSEHETIRLGADALYVTYRPNGEEVAVATLDGQISFFHCRSGTQITSIEGRKDLGSGRSDTDLITAKKSLQGKAFTSLSYTADGEYIIAGGQSKNVCIYNVKEGILIKKFEITQNRSMDAVDDFINRRKLTEFGNMNLVEEREETEGGKVTLRLPGVRKGDMASRSIKPEIRVYDLQFAPTEIGITPQTLKAVLKEKEFTKALMMSLKLNELKLIREVVENVPYNDISLTVSNLHENYVERLMKFLANEMENTKHFEFYLLWVKALLTENGQRNNCLHSPILMTLQKNLQRKYDDLSKLCDFNQYTMLYLMSLSERKHVEEIEDEELNDEVDE